MIHHVPRISHPLRLWQVPQSNELVSEAEYRALEFFQLHTVNAFSTNIAPYVLQAAFHEPIIRTIAVAIGSMHRSFVFKPDLFSSSDDHTRFTLRHYTKAIGQLVSLDLKASTKTNDTFLIACVLFFCFECLQGNYKAAFQHATSGLKIIKNHVDASRQSVSTYMPPETLALLFIVLENQCLEIKNDDLVDSGLLVPGTSPFPSPVDSLANPSLSIDQLMRSFQILYNDFMGFEAICECISLDEEAISSGLMSDYFPQDYHRLVAGLKTWMHVFDDWVERGGAVDQEKSPSFITLKIWRLAIQLILSLDRPVTELSWDNHDFEYEGITRLAAEMMGLPLTDTAPNSPGNLPSEDRSQQLSPLPTLRPKPLRSISSAFSLSLGINTPLYLVATRCRHSTLRHRAINLLSFGQRREGLWDYDLAVRIAKQIIAIEESSVGIEKGTCYTAADIPLADRVSRIYVQFEEDKVLKVRYDQLNGTVIYEETYSSR